MGHFLFDLVINDFFYDMQHSQVYDFADDLLIKAKRRNLDSVISNIENNAKIVIPGVPEKTQQIWIILMEAVSYLLANNYFY